MHAGATTLMVQTRGLCSLVSVLYRNTHKNRHMHAVQTRAKLRFQAVYACKSCLISYGMLRGRGCFGHLLWPCMGCAHMPSASEMQAQMCVRWGGWMRPDVTYMLLLCGCVCLLGCACGCKDSPGLHRKSAVLFRHAHDHVTSCVNMQQASRECEADYGCASSTPASTAASRLYSVF